jgi:hypothetical protein
MSLLRPLVAAFIAAACLHATTAAHAAGVPDEVSALREDMAREVPNAVIGGRNPDDDAVWIARAQAALQGGSSGIGHPQLMVVVDRSPAVQALRIVAADPGGEWRVVGGDRVSTGKPGRKEHFKTPVGVFLNTADILGYRAEGTYNENHIRGLGIKGMRVWDFGWQETDNWRSPGAKSQIRLEMHATDPAVLEPRIGRPDSEGCVRLHGAMNRFIDRHGIIDADYEQAAAAGQRSFAALLPPGRTPSSLAGDALVVVDSSLR